MLRKSLIRESVKFAADLFRRGAIGVVAGCVVELVEASPALGIAIARQMLRQDIDRLRVEFERQGADISRLVPIDPNCGQCRKEMH